jgi:hypothetical protein
LSFAFFENAWRRRAFSSVSDLGPAQTKKKPGETAGPVH